MTDKNFVRLSEALKRLFIDIDNCENAWNEELEYNFRYKKLVGHTAKKMEGLKKKKDQYCGSVKQDVDIINEIMGEIKRGDTWNGQTRPGQG